jgi:hypothetical protein
MTIDSVAARILIVLALTLTVAVGSFIKGMEHEQAKETARELTQANNTIVITRKVATVTSTVDVETLHKIRDIESENTRLSEYIKNRLKEPAPIVVAGDTCNRNATVDFIRVWNASNTGENIATASTGNLDGTNTGIGYIQIAEQHNNESTYCRTLEKKIIGWQSYYSQLLEIFNAQ